MTWVLFAIHVLVDLAVIVAALVAVRPKLPRGAYTLAAAGIIDLLSTCCSRGLWSSIDYEGMDYDTIEIMQAGGTCLAGAQSALVVLLVVVAAALMAREAKPPAPPA